MDPLRKYYLDQLKEKVKELQNQVEDKYICSGGTFDFGVNVKLHDRKHWYWDLDKAMSGFPEQFYEQIREEFTDERIDDLHKNWIELNCEDIYDWIRGYWDYDKYYEQAIGLVKENSAGFCGRMGGHFCFDTHHPFKDYLYEITDYIDAFINDEFNEPVDDFYWDQEQSYKRENENYEKCQWILEQVKNHVNCMVFQDELEFRVEEFVNDLEYEEQKLQEHLEQEEIMYELIED